MDRATVEARGGVAPHGTAQAAQGKRSLAGTGGVTGTGRALLPQDQAAPVPVLAWHRQRSLQEAAAQVDLLGSRDQV